MKLKTIWFVTTLLFSVMAIGQITVKGKVSDSKKEPLVGVNVILKGTTIGSITDINGNYSLNVPNKQAEIEFSYIGFNTKLVKVEANTIINVVLESSDNNLDEIVVIGFASVKKSDLTSSIATVKGKELKTMTVGNAAESLQGKAAGIQVVNSGGPGSVPKVLIRGISTINLSTDPLYVIDGIPMGTNINFLNTNEIESMEILKDASASAIYGSRASNGVILITTKRGKKGETTFNFDTSYGIQFMKNPYHMADAEEYATIFNTAAVASGLPAEFGDPASYRGKSTDWWNAGIRERAAVRNISFGLQGGTEKHTFAVSLNYYKQDSFYEKGGWEKFTSRISSDYKFSKKISAGYSLNPRYESYGNPGNWADFDRIDPITPIYKPADQLTGDENEFSIYARSPSYVWNPVALVKRFKSKTKNYALATNGYIQITPVKGLIIRSQGSFELNSNISDNFNPDFIIDVAHESQLINSLSRSTNLTRSWSIQNTATYMKTLGEKHDFSLMVGNTAEEYNGANLYGSIQALPNNNDNLQELNAGTLNPKTYGTSYTNSIMSYLSRLTYNFDSKYYLTATYRRDGSSKFLANNKWASFPSASFAWRASNEKFMSDVSDVLSDLKFRVGWGKVGNQNLPASVYLSKLGQNFYTFGDQVVNTTYPSAVPNKDIKWETVEDINAGVDFGLFSNKLSGTIEAYRKTTENMLFQKSYPNYSGYPNDARIWSNVGSMRSQGLEFSLSYKNNVGDFNYGANLNFTNTNVKMIKLSAANEQLFGFGEKTLTVENDEPGYFYGYKADGLFQNQFELNSHTNNVGVFLQPNAKVGDVRFTDVNGDGILNADDRTKIGSPWAKYTVGLNLNASYKRFDFLANIYSSIGNDLVNQNKNELYNALSRNNKISGLSDLAWHGEGTSTSIPRLSQTDNNQNFSKFSSYYVEDGSFVRLKNIQFGYTINNKMGFDKIRCSLSGQNLLTLTKYSGVEPEVGGDVLGFGFGGWNYPVQKTILFGLNVTF
ncbi:TonB-linked outer membrane protein, SusC/RagA family [Flavobacterium gillisiae]|uniref:TonB-linked outer membrane protein, SusC/RagA family n=1 Tax=Flavobacterium gillisiae TaxID=150146 RepID=A0A1H4F815_9FLAO|nr:TonB-dependent receptor [Flavobacterium gillisiae]SEA93341.1 TonB-linked outer membrane protein, SusC/RagA family [Flavobacterium gillisiae]